MPLTLWTVFWTRLTSDVISACLIHLLTAKLFVSYTTQVITVFAINRWIILTIVKMVANLKLLFLAPIVYTCIHICMYKHMGICVYIRVDECGYMFECTHECWNWHLCIPQGLSVVQCSIGQWHETNVLDNWQLVVLPQSEGSEFDSLRVHDNSSVPLWVYIRFPGQCIKIKPANMNTHRFSFFLTLLPHLLLSELTTQKTRFMGPT